MLLGDLAVGLDEGGLVGLGVELDRLPEALEVLIVLSGPEGGLGEVVVVQGLVFLGGLGLHGLEHVVGLLVAAGVEVDVGAEESYIRPIRQAGGHRLGDVVDSRACGRDAEDVLLSGHGLDKIPPSADGGGLAGLDRHRRDPPEVVPQVEVGRAQLVAEDGAVEPQPQGRPVGIGRQGEGVGGKVDVPQLVVVRGALGVLLDRLLVVLACLLVVVEVVLGLCEHVVGAVVVAVL